MKAPEEHAQAFEAEYRLQIGEINYVDPPCEYGSDEMIAHYIEAVNRLERASLHPEYKVGAMIVGRTVSGRVFVIPAVNQMPKPLQGKFEIGAGGSFGGGAHAEMEALVKVPDIGESIESYHVFTSKTCCPSCAKMLSVFDNADETQPKMEGIYTDGRSLSGAYTIPGEKSPVKFWTLARRMLRPILVKGGLRFHLIGHNNDESLVFKDKFKIGSVPQEVVWTENNIKLKEVHASNPADLDKEKQLAKAYKLARFSMLEDKHAAIAYGVNKFGQQVRMRATDSLPPGFVYADDVDEVDRVEDYVRVKKGKDSYTQRVSTLENLLGTALRYGIRLQTVVTTEIPPAGVMLNAVSAGIEEFVTDPIMLNVKNNQDHRAFADLILSGVIRCDGIKIPRFYRQKFEKEHAAPAVEI